MAIYPDAHYMPIPPEIIPGGAPPRMVGYVGWCLHVTEGGAESPYAWFTNPDSQAFSHFWIGDDGRIEQYMDTVYQSWAQMAGNPTYISVETAGYNSAPLTPQQLTALAELLAWSHKIGQMPYLVATDTPGTVGFIGHGDGGAAWGNHPYCPGVYRLAQRQSALDMALAIVNRNPNPKPQPPEVNDVLPAFAYDPISGGSWALIDEEGHTDAFDGAPSIEGTYQGETDWPAVGISFWKGEGNDFKGNGIVIYRKPPEALPNGAVIATFHFNRRNEHT